MPQNRPLRSFPVPANESARNAVVDALGLVARKDDPFFDHVTAMARLIFDIPIAFLSVIHRDDQIFLSVDGSDLAGTLREASICAHTIVRKSTIVVPDTHADPRFVAHPIVVNPPHIRFYIGAPVVLSSGFCVGTICCADLLPRDRPTERQIAQLESLATMVARFYDLPFEPADPTATALLNRIAHEAQDEFLSLIGHELRTPLNGILGLAQVLEPADAEQAQVIEGITASGDHLCRVVDSILAFTDLRSGDITLEEGPVDLAALITATVSAFRKLAQISGKMLIVERIADDPQVIGDRAKLELAIGCLVANFIAHGGALGQLSVVRQTSGELTIEINDNGPGIAPDRQAAVWRAFGVGARLSGRAADGIGLGLPLANRVIELHGGELDLIRHSGRMSALIRLPSYRALVSQVA